MILPPETWADLRQKAEQATPGPWEDDRNGCVYDREVHNRSHQVCDVSCGLRADAAFIAAAHPATVLALLRQIDELETAARALVEACEDGETRGYANATCRVCREDVEDPAQGHAADCEVAALRALVGEDR